jgi:uncharacterized protein (DUF1778 family)
MSDGSFARAKKKRHAPWRGRKRVKDSRDVLINLRCTYHERAAIKSAAEEAGLSVGAFLRALALGDAGPRAVRRPPVELAELSRLLGALNKIGSNANQIAKAVNTTRNLPSWSELAAIRGDIGDMRAAVLKAIGRDN